MSSTESALIARQVDSETAHRLKSAGFTISRLKQMKVSDLIALGLTSDVAQNIASEQRPPIPTKTINKVLFDNRFQCCICRSSGRSIIVHHIEEYATSRDHSPANLAVLCLEHHNDAHTKRGLSANLPASRIKSFKSEWEAQVKRSDARSIIDALKADFASWNYMNELRIFDLAKQFGVDATRASSFREAVRVGVASSDGLPSPPDPSARLYKYEGRTILHRYDFVTEVFSALITKLPIINISDYLDKGVLGISLVSGDFIFVQGKHIFSPHNRKRRTGPGQLCDVTRAANGVVVRSTIDRWEATSSSAWSEWLSGTPQQGSLLHVKDVARENGKLILSGTTLGICFNRGELKTREYAGKLWQSGAFRDPYDQNSDEDEDDRDFLDFDDEDRA